MIDVKPGRNNECWNWKGRTRRYRHYTSGYFKIGAKYYTNNRVTWALTHGMRLPDLCVLHTCDNSLCCNPRHLFLGTHQDNVDDMVSKGRNHLNYGADPKRQVLTQLQIDEIRTKYNAHCQKYIRWNRSPQAISMQQLANEYGVSIAAISRAINNVCRRKERTLTK